MSLDTGAWRAVAKPKQSGGLVFDMGNNVDVFTEVTCDASCQTSTLRQTSANVEVFSSLV